MRRRGFLGALAALACAPFVPKETLAKMFRKPLVDKPMVDYAFPTVWMHRSSLPQSMGDIHPETIKMMDDAIKHYTEEMLKQSNKWMYGNGEVYNSLPKKLQYKYDAGEREFFNSPLWRGLTTGKE